MREPFPIIMVFAFTALCGVLAGVVVYVSPNPMPAGNAQLLAAFIALFSAGGYALLKVLTPQVIRKGPKKE